MGGSSAINAQALIPFSSADLDAWESLIGNEGWNSSLASYLNKAFSVVMPDADTARHLNVSWAEDLASSSKGPVNATFLGVQQDPVPKAWIDVFANLGYPLTASPFSGHSTGAYNALSTVNSTTKHAITPQTRITVPSPNDLISTFSRTLSSRVFYSANRTTGRQE